MADTATTFEQVQAFFKNLDPTVALSYFEKLTSSTSGLAEAFKKLSGFGQDTNDTFKNGADTIEKLGKVVDRLITGVEDLGREFNLTSEHLDEIGGEIAKVGFALASGIRPTAFEALNDHARDASSNLQQVNQDIKNIQNLLSIVPVAGGPIKKLIDTIMPMKELADAGKKAETGMINMAAASGQLGTLLEQVGNDFSGLDDYMRNYNELISSAAQGTGNTISQVGKYAAALNQIPGALDKTIDVTKDGMEQMKMLDVTMKLAAGTGQDTAEVIKDMNEVYREFGTTGTKAAEYIARVSAASQDLKMPLDIVKNYTLEAAKSFKFLGDNSQAAITILGKMGSALKDSGLGPQAIAQLTQGVIKNIEGMSLAQNAFISQTSKGVGGLQGAFQIDLLKKQGKLDEVAKMTEDSLRKQFGGRVVTLEEGAKGGGAQAQLAKEVQLLTTGPTKIAGTKEEAYAILDAMKKGEIFKPGEGVKSPQKALEDTVNVGNNLQKRNNDLTTVLVNFAEKQTLFAAISANAAQRNLTGSQGPAAKYLEESMRVGSEKAAAINLVGPEATVPKEESLSDMKKNMGSELSKIGDSVKSSIATTKIQQQAKQQQQDYYKAQQGKAPASSFLNTLGSMYGGDVNKTKPTTPRGAVAGELRGPPGEGAGTLAGRRGAPTGRGETSTIHVQTVCADCQRKVAKAVAIDVVNGKLAEHDKNKTNHSVGSYT